MNEKLDNSKEFNLHVTLKKRSDTGVAEKDRKEISFFGEESQASRASHFKHANSSKPGKPRMDASTFQRVASTFRRVASAFPKVLSTFRRVEGHVHFSFATVCCCSLLFAAMCCHLLLFSCVILFAAVSCCLLPLAVVCCSSLVFSTFAAVCCCLLPFAAAFCCFCCLPLLLPLARFARNFNPNTMTKMSPEASKLFQNDP